MTRRIVNPTRPQDPPVVLPEPQRTEVVVTRLQPDVYRQLEGQCPKPMIDGNTTEVQAGFLSGVQFVLYKLREGFINEAR